MAQDIIITPSGGQIEWLNDATGVAMIDIDANNNLSITNSGGDLSIGDTASDVYIGDGTNNVDLIFEQNGSIRGTGSQTITLGQSGDTISVAGSTFNPQSDIVFTAADTRGMYLNNTSGNQVYVRLLGSTELDLGSDNRIRFVESDNGSVRAVFDLNSGKAKVGNGASETPVATWQIEDNNQSTTQTNFTQALDRAGLLIETGYTANAYTPGLFWMTNNNNASKPKAGIYLQLAGSGSRILFGTSNNYGTGLTNTAMVINESGSVGIVTQTLPTSNRFHVSSGSSGSASKSSIAVVSVADNSTFNNGTAALHVINSGNRGTKGNSIGSDLLRLEFSDGIHTIFNKDGSVGIGTTSPVKKLDVRAAASWDGIHIGSTAGSATAIDFARSTTHANPTARIGVAEPAATHTSDMRFFTSDASGGAPNLVEKMRIDQNGNVGIGTDAPTYSLHINRSTPSLTLETAANSNDPVITLKSNSAITNEGAQIWYDNSIGTLHIQTTYPSDAADIVFHTRTGADQSTGNVRMVIAGDGNVGIGTSTPSAKLHVVGPTLGSTLNVESKLLHIRSSLDGNTGHLEIKDVRTSAGTTWTTSGRRIQMKVDSTYMAYIQFNGTGNNYGLSFGAGASSSAPGNSAEAMRIVSSGSVGIGTTNPGDVLHVDGNTIIGDTDRDSIVLTLKAQNTAGAPAATTKLVMQGYEGRGIGTFYEDSSYSGKEWFCGMNYSAAFAFWNVGYDASGGQAEYNANTLFRVRNTGRVEMLNYGSGTFTGTAAYKLAVDSSGNIIETAVGSGQVDGSGTANYITRWSDTDTIGNSNIFDNGNIGVGTAADLNGKVNISAQGNSEGDQHIFCQLSHSAVNHGAAIFLKTSTSNLNNRYGVRIRAIRNANNNAAADLAFSLENSGATALAEVVRFTSDGHVGIGTTNPSNYSNTAARDLVINRADHAGITIYNNAASKSGNIYFADAGSLFAGFISYTHSNNNMLFGANATTIMTLSEDNVDLTGDLTVDGTATVGESVNAAGLIVKRASSGDPYIQFNKGSTRHAYIQSYQNKFYVTNDNASDIHFRTQNSDNLILYHGGTLFSNKGGDLGTSASRWSTIYGSAGDFSGHINISNDYGIVWGGGNSRPYIIGNKTNGTIVFGEGGSEHLRINTNGNVGIGTAQPGAAKLDIYHDGGFTNDLPTARIYHRNNPDSGNARVAALDINVGMSNSDLFHHGYVQLYNHFTGGPYDSPKLYFSSNSYNSSTNHRQWWGIQALADTTATGDRLAFTCDLSSANPTATPVHIMSLLTAGNVGIGVVAPDNYVNIRESTLSSRPASNSNTSLTIEHATDTGIQFFSATQTQLRFGDAASTAAGAIIYEHGDDNFKLNITDHLTINGTAAERVRVQNDGNVGIGTTNPTKLLTVNGQIGLLLSGTARLHMRADSDRTYFEAQSGNGLRFTTTGGGSLDILNGGSVGIGTTAPTAHLHVSKASGATTVLTQVAANSTVGFEIKKTGSTTQHWKIVDGQTVNGTLEFYDATDSATRMAINGNGKVGIGTNAPNKTFQVNWSSSDTTITTGNGLAGGQAGAGALIQNTSSTAGIYANLDFRAYDADARIAVKKAAANTADFYFIQDNNTTFTTNMVIRANGSVGIGTTNPGSRLEVHNGNVQIKNTGSNSFKFFGIKFGPAPYFLDGTRIFEWETLNSAGSSTLSKFALAIDSDGNALICNGTSGYTPRIAINASTGNVGIGTTAHGSYKHYVYGSTGASGTKYFDMPHPDPSKKADGYRLRHGAVEAPAFGENLYRFTVTIPSDEGTVTTDLPGYFTFLNENPQIWIQARNMFARAYGEINEGLTSFTVTGEKTGQYDVLIIGSRKPEASDKDGQVFTAEYKD